MRDWLAHEARDSLTHGARVRDLLAVDGEGETNTFVSRACVWSKVEGSIQTQS